MKVSARTFAAMLTVLALAAFQSDMDAQPRGNSHSSSTSRASSDRPAARPAARPGQPPKPDFKPGNQHKPIGVRPPAARPPQHHRPPVHRPAPPRPGRPHVRPIVVRPSYGSVIAADIAAGMAWMAVNVARFNALARTPYLYNDGVFCSQEADGRYYVIAPPVGALVETLPEDFETVILNGENFYKVDNTIYRMTVVEGKPYFEVVGQINQTL